MNDYTIFSTRKNNKTIFKIDIRVGACYSTGVPELVELGAEMGTMPSRFAEGKELFHGGYTPQRNDTLLQREVSGLKKPGARQR